MFVENFFDIQRFTETITLTEDSDTYNVAYGQTDKIFYGLGGDDEFWLGADSVTIDCGAGDDEVWNSIGTGVSIFGGDGDDYIISGMGASTIGNNPRLMSLASNTVRGGAGNDKIQPTFPAVIQFASGDGNDTVGYCVGQSTLQVDGDYYTLASGVDTIVYVGEDSILFQGTDIGGMENYGVAIVGGNQISPPDTSTENTETATAGSTSNILEKNGNAYTYSSGNKNITNYSAGQKINFNANFKGLGFNDSDFMLNSASGSLTIQNARDKVIDVAVNNNTVAYAYLANGGGEINGGGISQLEVIIGGNNSANTITAGSGGSSLWGGASGNDILTGGAGTDTFFYGKNDGADVINNASSSDVVNLYDVSLSDVLSADISISGSKISIGFNNGNSVQVNSTENLSPTFKLSGGSFKYNQSTGQWQNA